MLTDLAVRKLTAQGKAYTKYDSEGLYVYVTPAGRKSWRVKYTFKGKAARKVIGSYPALSLADARALRDEMFKGKVLGHDPSLVARRRKLVGDADGATFEHFARKWMAGETARWRAHHAEDVKRALERDIFPDLGDFPIDQIDKPLMLAVLKKVEDRGAIETAHRLRQRAEAIFNFAAAMGVDNTNPAASLGAALKPKPTKKRWPAVTTVKAARTILSEVDTTGASPIVRASSRFLAITAQRPGMVRSMKWADLEGIDWSNPNDPAPAALWRIPAAEMKLDADDRASEDFDHEVPLPLAAVEILRAIRPMTGSGVYVFWSGRGGRKPMSENALSALYKRLGYQTVHVPHGWRSTFSTIMNEQVADWNPLGGTTWRQIIDLMLAHQPVGMSGSEFRYNRARFAKQRRQIADAWADLLLEGAVDPGRVVSGPRRRPLR